jgi:hypothetical protein
VDVGAVIDDAADVESRRGDVISKQVRIRAQC